MSKNKMLEYGNFLLKDEKGILRKLAEAGMKPDDTTPDTYFIPTTLFFDVGKGRDEQIRAPYAILAMAKASNTIASFDEVDSEGCPVEDVENGEVKMVVYDPFAQKIEEAVQDWQQSEIAKGNARIVNGKFWRIA